MPKEFIIPHWPLGFEHIPEMHENDDDFSAMYALTYTAPHKGFVKMMDICILMESYVCQNVHCENCQFYLCIVINYPFYFSILFPQLSSILCFHHVHIMNILKFKYFHPKPIQTQHNEHNSKYMGNI